MATAHTLNGEKTLKAVQPPLKDKATTPMFSLFFLEMRVNFVKNNVLGPSPILVF